MKIEWEFVIFLLEKDFLLKLGYKLVGGMRNRIINIRKRSIFYFCAISHENYFLVLFKILLFQAGVHGLLLDPVALIVRRSASDTAFLIIQQLIALVTILTTWKLRLWFVTTQNVMVSRILDLICFERKRTCKRG